MPHLVDIECEGDADDEQHHGEAVGGAEGLHDESVEDAGDG